MNKTAENEKTWPWLPSLSTYGAGGAVEQQLRAQQNTANASAAAAAAKVNEQMVPAILGLGILGVGAGLTGTKLYNLINQLNKPKDKYTKFGPGPKRIDNEEKIAADSWAQTLIDALSAVPKRVGGAISAGAESFNSLAPNQQAVMMPAGLLAAGLGLYGGHSLARTIDDRRKKEDMEHELEEARKDYQRALTGKRAEALDSAFDSYKKTAQLQTKKALGEGAVTFADYLAEPLRQTGLWPLYTTAVLGTGLLSGKMTYDWTRERSKDKALERARRSRARMEESSPLYIDPAQLEAIKALHQKEIDKIKQQTVV